MLSERFETVCKTFADRQAFFGPAGEPVTYRNFFFTLAAFAERLDDLGLESGDHVSIDVRDAIVTIALRLAVLRLGAVIVPGAESPAYRLDCRLVDRGDTQLAPVPKVRVDQTWVRSPTRLIPVRGGGKMVTASSGTTGLPKLRLMDEAGILARVENGRRLRDTHLSPALVAYAAASTPGFSNVLRVLFAGGCVMLMEETPEATLCHVAQRGAELALIPAAKLPVLLAAAEAIGPQPYRLKRIQCGGGAISPTLAAQAEARFGAEVTNSYGSNETGSIAHFRPASRPDESGIVGAVYPHLDLRFVTRKGEILPPETGGEVQIKVPQALWSTSFPDGVLVQGQDGWVSTGDIGRLIGGGLLKLEGRVSDLINLGGNKRAPVLFESPLHDLAGVKEVAAFRVPRASGIDGVGVAVVSGAGFDPAVAVERLRKVHGAGLDLYLFELEALPLTAAGKIDRRALSARYCDPAETGVQTIDR